MTTTRLTMAQALVKFLDNQYIEVDGVQSKFVAGVFTIFGHGNVLGLGQALEQDSGDLVVHQGRNEQGMAHAAIGFAKQHLRRKIYACTASVGPGAANMLTAAATATANRIPLLLLPGDVYASRQPDPVLQQIEQFHDLSISTNDAFRSVSKYWDRINRPEQLMSAAIHAMRVLTDPAETGAVTLALPQDVQAEAWDYPDYFLQKRVHRLDRRPPTEAMIGDAVGGLRGQAQAVDHLRRRGQVLRGECGPAGICRTLRDALRRNPGGQERGAVQPSAERRRDRRNRLPGREPVGRRGRPDHRDRHALHRFHHVVEVVVQARRGAVPQPQHQPRRCVETRWRASAGGCTSRP